MYRAVPKSIKIMQIFHIVCQEAIFMYFILIIILSYYAILAIIYSNICEFDIMM